MNSWYFPGTPIAPDYTVDWDEIMAMYDWLKPLESCPQNPVYHGEGNVLIHTRLVCEALVGLAGWRSLDPTSQSILFAAALMHDIAKPGATVVDEAGQITAKGHVRQGVKLAMGILWNMGVAVEHRMAVAGVIGQGSLPLWFWDKGNPEKAMITASVVSRCDWIALMAEADVLGRWCDDREAILDRVKFFREYAMELGVFDRPWAFPSDHSRFCYFQKEAGDPRYEAFDDRRCEVILMSGLPGVGKDTWVAQHYGDYPVVSLDAIRRELGVTSRDSQGQVIALAKERAKGYLRAGRSFVWNATNLSQQLRGQLIGMFGNYGARVRIVYLEVPLGVQQVRNRSRSAVVPQGAIDRMVGMLEVPSMVEAHEVRWVVPMGDSPHHHSR
jgi:predicted kinase